MKKLLDDTIDQVKRARNSQISIAPHKNERCRPRGPQSRLILIRERRRNEDCWRPKSYQTAMLSPSCETSNSGYPRAVLVIEISICAILPLTTARSIDNLIIFSVVMFVCQCFCLTFCSNSLSSHFFCCLNLIIYSVLSLPWFSCVVIVTLVYMTFSDIKKCILT